MTTPPTPTSTPTLTDRYVWAVLRCVPSRDRDDLEREIRTLIADTIEAKAADGTLDAGAAERAALTELGDPAVLAARYGNRIDHLLGPTVYPVWRGIVTLVLAALVPVLLVVVTGASLMGGGSVGEALVAGVTAAFNAGVQTLFWLTLVFALIERFAGSKEREELASAGAELSKAGLTGVTPTRGKTWTLDDLPKLPDQGRVGLGELAGAIVGNIVVIALLVWAQVGQPIVIDGQAYPLFDPAVASIWVPWFIVIALAEIVFTFAIYRRGRWSFGYAIGNTLLGAAFAIPAVYLIANDLLLNPDLVAALPDGGGTWLPITRSIIQIAIIVIVAWDAVEGFLKARRASTA